MGNTYEKTFPLNKSELSDYSGEWLFKAAQRTYVCTFLMRLAGQIDKAKHLLSYTVRLMSEDSVRSFGKNWDDLDIPIALVTDRLTDEYSKRFSISKKAAAGRLLTEDPQCATLNEATEKMLMDLSR
jgi:hypothetical protein